MAPLHGFFNQYRASRRGSYEYTTPIPGKNVFVTEVLPGEGDAIPSTQRNPLTDYVGIVLTMVRRIDPENCCEEEELEEGRGEADG